MKIALATDRAHPLLTDDDAVLFKVLKQDHEVDICIWDDWNINWSYYDVVIIRSIWDYFHKPDLFTYWLKRLAALSVNVLNPVELLEWNKHKGYLMEVAQHDILIAKTEIAPVQSHFSLHQKMLEHDWEQMVIKPCVSAGAFNTWICSKDQIEAHQSRFDLLNAANDFLLQAFLPQILEDGEYSFIYFGKKFSHAVIKKPKPGDFRVQAEHGGKHALYVPSADQLKAVQKIMDLVEGYTLYARMDGCFTVDRKFVLMEIELIEPYLFFKQDELSAYRCKLELEKSFQAFSLK